LRYQRWQNPRYPWCDRNPKKVTIVIICAKWIWF
jgi:hypothetical protein